MKFSGLVNRLLVGATIVSMTISASPVLANGLESIPSQRVMQQITDVSLSNGNIFHGHVVASDGQTVANETVFLQQEGRRVAETTSDQNGAFAFQGVRGGTYLVSTKDAVSVCRVWAPQTAPPAAKNAAMLVSNGEVVRGQFAGSGVILTTLVIAGVTWGVIEILDDGSGS